MREVFFGSEASTTWSREALVLGLPNYTHYDADIRYQGAIEAIFRE